MPTGALVTVPVAVPVPVETTARTRCSGGIGGGGGGSPGPTKGARTSRAAFIVPVHRSGLGFESQPLQLASSVPAPGVAARVTSEPSSKSPPQTAPQSIPAGALVTVPLAAP